MKKIGIIDTAYSRVDMATVIEDEFRNTQLIDYQPVELVFATVPGHKELAVGALRLIENNQCNICITLGWVGPKECDQTSAHEAALAIAMAKVKTSCHILECFIFEANYNEEDLAKIASKCAVSHLKSALQLVSVDPMRAVPSSIGDREGQQNASVLRIE